METALDLTTKIDAPDLKEQVSKRTGIEKSRFKTVQMQLDTLRKQGLLIDLNISGTSMFNKSASFAEMGISEEGDDMRASRLAHATKFLIPDEQIKRLRSIEARMRQALDRLSYDVTGFRPFRWLPLTAYDAFVEKFLSLQAELEAVKQDILSHYDEYVDRLAKDFTKVSEASWKSITAQGYQWVILEVNKKRIPHDRDMFIDYIVTRALAKMPSKTFIEVNLMADYVPALLESEQDLAADKAKAQVIRAQAEAVQAEINADKEVEYQKAAAAQAEYQHKKNMMDLEEQEKMSKFAAIVKAEAEHARQQMALMKSPYEQVFTTLRDHMSQSCLEIRDSIKSSGFVRGKVAERGKGLLEYFQLMAIHDDKELLKQLQELDKLIGDVGQDRPKGAPDRNTDKIIEALTDIVDLADSAKDDLVSGPSRFDFVEF